MPQRALYVLMDTSCTKHAHLLLAGARPPYPKMSARSAKSAIISITNFVPLVPVLLVPVALRAQGPAKLPALHAVMVTRRLIITAKPAL